MRCAGRWMGAGGSLVECARGQVQGYIGHEVGSGLRLGERAGLALGRWGLEAKQEEEEGEGAHGGAVDRVRWPESAGVCRWSGLGLGLGLGF